MLATVPRGTPSLIDRDVRAQRLREADLAHVKAVLRPVVLVPTPAQLARGQRLVDAAPTQCPNSALIMRTAAERAGWTTRLTYSHALMPPKRGNEDWWEQQTIALRVQHDERALRGYAVWANGLWDGAQAGSTIGGALDLLTVRAYGSSAFADLLAGVVREVLTVVCPFTLCGATVKAKRDGTPYAHKWLDGRCPGTM